MGNRLISEELINQISRVAKRFKNKDWSGEIIGRIWQNLKMCYVQIDESELAEMEALGVIPLKMLGFTALGYLMRYSAIPALPPFQPFKGGTRKGVHLKYVKARFLYILTQCRDAIYRVSTNIRCTRGKSPLKRGVSPSRETGESSARIRVRSWGLPK